MLHCQLIHLLTFSFCLIIGFRYFTKFSYIKLDKHDCISNKNVVLHNLQIKTTKHVILFSILNRSNLEHQTSLQFNSNVTKLNKILKDLCQVDNKITFHRHKGFWYTQDRKPLPITIWSHDGVHPNTKFGREHYTKSL